MKMKHVVGGLLLGLAACASGASAGNGFEPLFNGKDLSGWTQGPTGAWAVEDGVITLKRGVDGQEHNGDYLWTKEAYGDFVLELEFKVPEQANSGVFFRTSDLDDPVYTGFEMQVANSFGRPALSRTGTAGALYDLVAPVKNPARKAGEWNQARIVCKGPRVEISLNGELVVEADLDRWTETGKNPDGSKNKFKKPIRDFARIGRIGLQDHGRPVWYRNLRIRRL
jgi:hypothetical protein